MSFFNILFCLTIFISFTTVKFLISFFKKRLVDIPNARSSHITPTPRGGGIGFILAFFFVLALGMSFNKNFTLNTLLPWLALIPLIISGFIDDWKDLPASIRYLVQLSVSSMCVYILGPFPISQYIPTIILVILTVVGMTALINFVNFMDGLDGLVAGISIIQLSYLAIWNESPILWFLVAALLGFLIWNWSPAKIFMGDSGSTFLGAAIAIALLSKQTSSLDAWSTLTITLPITLDTIYTLICRLIRGENIFQAHRSHLFQRLHQSGWSHSKVSSIYIAASIILCVNLFQFEILGGLINLIGAGFSLIIVELYLNSKTPKNLEMELEGNVK